MNPIKNAIALAAALFLGSAPLALSVAQDNAAASCLELAGDQVYNTIPDCAGEGYWLTECLDTMKAAAKNTINGCTERPASCTQACGNLYHRNVVRCDEFITRVYGSECRSAVSETFLNYYTYSYCGSQ